MDNRCVISGILHVSKVDCRWCDCSTKYDTDRRCWRTTGSTADRTGASGPSCAGRHFIENVFCRFQEFYRVATRFDKLAANFVSGVVLDTDPAINKSNPK